MSLPSGEIMYDRDGSYALRTTGDQVSIEAVLSQGNLETLRRLDSSSVGMGNSSRTTYLFFPEPMDLTRFWFGPINNSNSQAMNFSTDSGAPGTGSWFDWSHGGSIGANTIGGTAYSFLSFGNMALGVSNPQTFHASAVGVTAVRWRTRAAIVDSSNLQHLRFWGVPSNPTTYLQPWHPTLDEAAPDDWFDYGAIERGTDKDIEFRIKNLHPSLNANNVTLTTPNSFGSNNPHTHITFDGGSGFDNPLNIGTVNADSLSPVITMRRTVDIGQALGAALTSLVFDGTWAT
jgi:hypothetical protein